MTFVELYFIASPKMLDELTAALEVFTEQDHLGLEMRMLRNLVESTLDRSGRKPASQKCLASAYMLAELEMAINARTQSGFPHLALLTGRVRGALGVAA